MTTIQTNNDVSNVENVDLKGYLPSYLEGKGTLTISNECPELICHTMISSSSLECYKELFGDFYISKHNDEFIARFPYYRVEEINDNE
jgi:hypothetical protein